MTTRTIQALYGVHERRHGFVPEVVEHEGGKLYLRVHDKDGIFAEIDWTALLSWIANMPKAE